MAEAANLAANGLADSTTRTQEAFNTGTAFTTEMTEIRNELVGTKLASLADTMEAQQNSQHAEGRRAGRIATVNQSTNKTVGEANAIEQKTKN